MVVKELITKLAEFPEDLRVVDLLLDDIEIKPTIYIYNNYPYDKPDEAVIQIL